MWKTKLIDETITIILGDLVPNEEKEMVLINSKASTRMRRFDSSVEVHLFKTNIIYYYGD